MKKQVDCIFYLVDSWLYLYNLKTDEIKKYNLLNYLYYGRIIKVNQCIKKINEIIKQEKISKIFTGLKAIIIYEPYLQYNDKKIIIDTFDQCGFKDLKLVNAKELLKKNKTFIEINEKYLILYNEKKYNLFNINEYLSIEDILFKILKSISKEIYLIGINKNICNLADLNKNLFYLENSETYFFKKIQDYKKN